MGTEVKITYMCPVQLISDALTINTALLDLRITNNTDLITDVELRDNLGNKGNYI